MSDLHLFSGHRLFLCIAGVLCVCGAVFGMNWQWLAHYWPDILSGLWRTLALLISSVLVGFILSVLLGLAQVSGPKPLEMLARGFCTIIRGTPILLQLWVVYYGVGSVFPYIPGIRQSWLWPYLTEVWPYAFFVLTLSFAGYEGEVSLL